MVILVGTLLPAQELPPAPQWELIAFDSMVHAILFGTQLFLLLLALSQDPRLSFTSRTVLYSFLVVVAYGILIEILQGAMGLGRQADPGDAVSNTIGSFVGLAFWRFFRKVASRF